MKARVRLSDHFTYKKLFRFTLPTVIMAVFTSVYTIVDGLFVSRAVGDSAFAGLNLIFPFIMIVGAVGLMFGSGGSALIAKTLGEGDGKRANGYFSALVITIAVAGVVLGGLGIAVLRPVANLLGRNAKPETVENGILYGFILLCGMPFLMLQYGFQSFMVTAEKSTLGFLITVGAGVVNAVLDAALILGARLGLAGAALATIIGQAVGAAVPILYFACKNKSLLRLGRPRLEIKAFFLSAANGASELLSNISFSVVSMLYNVQLLRLAGDGGVIAFGIIMYMSTVFFNIFFGFSMGAAPIVGYHYGAGNKAELKNLKQKGFFVMGVLGVVLTVAAEGLASPFAKIFATSEEMYLLTKHGIHLYSAAYLPAGFSVFGSAYFTALNNGLVSGLISMLRSLGYQCGTVLLLPLFWGMTGVWVAATVAEVLAFATTMLFFLCMRKKYGYSEKFYGKTVDESNKEMLECKKEDIGE